MALTLLLIFVLGAIFVFSTKVLKPPRSNPVRRLIRSPQASIALLKKSSLESRALPNARLVRAFSINNAFTTTDADSHRFFVTHAKDLVRSTDCEWNALARGAASILEATLAANHAPLLLVPLVQSLVFRIVVIRFFPYAAAPSDVDVATITARINTLWLACKQCHATDPAALDREKKELLRKLHPLTPSPGRDAAPDPSSSCASEDRDPGPNPDQNPLNVILPAYETLWRAVLLCFLEVRFRASEPDRLVYSGVFSAFLRDPTRATFDARAGPSAHHGLTVKDIVCEALRLYPPTRRINREVEGEQLAVDVEYLHRDPDTWGSDALGFRPGRWAVPTSTERPGGAAYMPFGAGRFECPAKAVFGPMLIGVLVGTLLARVGSGFELVGEEVSEDILGSGPLQGARDSYAGVQLRIMGQS
ncbi:unnamed protein product [Diplocarpon coronariae]